MCLTKFDSVTEQQLIDMFNKGLSSKEISTVLNTSNTTLFRWINKLDAEGKIDYSNRRTKSKEQYNITCKCCGKEVLMARETAKYCSDKCKSEYNRNNSGDKHTCKNCMVSFFSYKNKYYCTKECQLEYMRKHPIIKVKIKKEPKEKKSITCIQCGKEHLTHLANTKYCSNLCGSLHRRNEKKVMVNKRCKECGKHFSSTNNRMIFCDKECSNKYGWRIKETNRRNVIRNNGSIDWDISIPKLIKRDGIKCYLCNEDCNRQDFIINSNGTTITGESYPSIEHVIAVANGGTHTWSNVKLAHRGCNNKKGTIELSEFTNKQEIQV